MVIAFRTARNLGLLILLGIIFLVSIMSFFINFQNSASLTEIITVGETKLRRWYDVAEIITDVKDRMYDYRLGRSEVIAPVDLLINRALTEVESIKAQGADEDELANIDEIVRTLKRLKQAVYAYETEVREGYRGGSSAKEMEEIAIQAADRVANLGRGAAAYVSRKINDKNMEILNLARVSRNFFVLMLILAVAATIVVAIIMARALSRPITNLVDGTERLSKGDLDHRVAEESNDEIGQLARSFNSMAEGLKESRRDLLKAKAFTDNIIKSMTNSLIVLNKDITILAVNKAACTLFGYEEDELIGRPASVLFNKDICKELDVENQLDAGIFTNRETDLHSKSGAPIRMLLSSSVMFDREGSIAGIVCVGQDITLQAEAVQAGHLASIGELAAGVAHEINNPINAIINFSQMLLDDSAGGKVIDLDIPHQIMKESDRIAVIVRSLLSFAREGDLEMESVNLHDVMEETLALAETHLRKDGITLKIDIPGELPKINGHFHQIEQVYLNIINNARYALNEKFPSSDPDKILEIQGVEKVEDNRPVVEISFYDHGTGISANDLAKIKNPFFSTKPAGTGTGLGLAISHGIIADHGGKLVIESKEGHYSRIIITLPAANSRANTVRIEQ